MTMPSRTISSVAPMFPIAIVCPVCKSANLTVHDERVKCGDCDFRGAMVDGYLDLIHGDRFEDKTDEQCLCYEENSNDYTAREYWIPLFRRLLGHYDSKPRLLAVGCGTGVEVDLLHGAGFETVGIEIGNRTAAWPRREASDWFMMANGLSMPFADNSFDAAFCGCVFPHVGVEGDSFNVTETGFEERLQLATEMQRVVRPGGFVIASSPNRVFPVDMFHWRDVGSYKPKFNLPGERFLLSAGDYSRMFEKAGLKPDQPVPSLGYWGFVRSKHSLKGRLFALPVRALFWITSKLPLLRGSVFAPWLVVSGRKP